MSSLFQQNSAKSVETRNKKPILNDIRNLYILQFESHNLHSFSGMFKNLKFYTEEG